MKRKYAYIVLPEVVAEAAKILLEGCNRVILYEDSMEEFNIPRTERYEKFNTEYAEDFAVAVELFVNNPNRLLKRFPNRFEFIKQVLFML